MRRLRYFVLTLLCAAAALAHATTYNIPSGSANAAVQSIISGASSGDTVAFASGTYHISTTLTLKCGVTYTGPVATPATAVLSASAANISLSKMAGGCTSGTTTLEYLRFDGAGAFSTDGQSYSNINILHNQFTSIPSEYCGSGCFQPCVSCQSIYFNFNSGITLSNLDIEYNVFGDANSCTSSAGLVPFSVTSDNFPGNCAGVIIAAQNPGAVNNLTISHNVFNHLEEAWHFLNVGYNSGGGTSYCNNCFFEYNYSVGIRRIQVEFQAQLWTNPMHIRYNVMGPPDYSSANAGQYAFSLPCCQFGQTFGGSLNGAFIDVSNNIIYDPSPTTSNTNGISWGAEAWGNNSTYEHNLMQGYVCVALNWGFVNTASQFSFNTLQSSVMAGGPCHFASGNGGFIGQEFPGSANANVPPTITGNVEQSTPTSFVSAAPTISPASGTYAGPLPVTMTDAGFTSGTLPLGNTSIYYTTDGTTPVPGSGTTKLYTGSFSVNLPATVKALGMWGSPNQPLSYPAGFGFTPSAVVTKSYTASGTSITLTSIALTCPVTALTAGAASENCTLTSNYSDSSHYDITTAADPHGNGPGMYSSLQPSVADISTTAVVTPLAAGTSNLKATVGVLTSTLPVSVTASGGGGGGGSVFLGNNQEDFTGFTSSGFFNSVYSISPPYATTVTNCHFFLPTDTITSGAHYDCLIIAAPSTTTEGSSAICHGTYTTTSSTAPNAFVSVALTGCGTIAASTPYWVATNTDDSSGPNFGFWQCGGSCTGSAPTTYGTGTYPSRWVAVSYGTYTGLPSSLSANPNQVSQYVDLTPTAPTLASGYQDNTLSVNNMVLGLSFQQHAYCVYSDGVVLPCDTTDARGSAVTAWTEDSSGVVLSIGAIGSGTPGLITGVGYGTTASRCTLTGGVPCSPYFWTVTNQPATAIQLRGLTVHGMKISQ